MIDDVSDIKAMYDRDPEKNISGWSGTNWNMNTPGVTWISTCPQGA